MSRVGKTLALALATDSPGEAAAAVAALKRVLAAAGLSVEEVAAAIDALATERRAAEPAAAVDLETFLHSVGMLKT
jgi:hypothetical protein